MAKKDLPTYTIGTLKNEAARNYRKFMADRFAHYLDDHPDLHFPHKHSFYHLVYFSKGSGNHSIDFTNFKVEGGQIYFMIPGQVHSWDFDKKPDGFIINFSGEYLTLLLANPAYLEQFRFFSGIATHQVINIPAKKRDEIEYLFEKIIKEGSADLPLKDDYIKTALLQLFIAVSRCTGSQNPDSQTAYNSVLLRNFQKLIDKNFREKKLTRDYAAILYVTPNHLNALCKDITGKSAGDLIRDRVILEAKRLLVNADWNISEIASELSFADNSYFSRFFKKDTGVSPEDFRKQISKK
ncbi:helix-turn-helix domain-containing protein [Pollutibacter soli]|uniref:helix-turn-helix domain-containing protein n=1 Tax=Pollutibacter soli TaxID=3034157 RepID=UPI003013EF0E